MLVSLADLLLNYPSVSNLVMICYRVISAIIISQTLLDKTLLLLGSLLENNGALDNDETGLIHVKDCPELKTLEWWISRSMLDLLFF